MSASLLSVFEEYQKARVRFVQAVAEAATRPQNVDTMQNAGVMALLRPLLLDNVRAEAAPDWLADWGDRDGAAQPAISRHSQRTLTHPRCSRLAAGDELYIIMSVRAYAMMCYLCGQYMRMGGGGDCTVMMVIYVNDARNRSGWRSHCKAAPIAILYHAMPYHCMPCHPDSSTW